MPWIESHQTVGTHPKTRKLARLLSVSVPAAVGHLHLLWHWCLQFATDGVLVHIDVDELAGAAMYDGPPDRFVEALVAAGFIDSYDEGMVVHDWHDYAGKLIERRTADAARKRSRAIPSEVQRTSSGVPPELRRTSGGQRAESVRNRNPNRTLTSTRDIEVITHSVNAPRDGAECVSGPDPVKSTSEPTARSPGRDRARLAASFDRWWSIWLKRVDRANALSVWLRLAPDDELAAAIVAATVEQNATRYSKVALQFVPGPAKWLRGRMWEDEVIAIEETGRETNRHDYARARLTAGAAGSAGPGGHDTWADEG